MTRLIKRYGSRKLYDPSESRYISLEDVAEWVRDGEEIRVIDNATEEDVTALTLTQVISEEGRKKSQFLPSDLLHDLIRAGETRVKQIQSGVEGFVKKSFDRIVPVTKARDEVDELKKRLDELERAVSAFEASEAEAEVKPKPKTAPARKTATRKPDAKTSARTGTKPAARKTAAKKPAVKKTATKAAGTAAAPKKTTSKTSKKEVVA